MPEIFLKNIAVPPNIIVCEIFLLEIFDLVKNVMCILGSMDCVLFSKDVKCHVYPENQGTHYKLNQIQEVIETPPKIGSCFREISMTSRIWLSLPCVPWFPETVYIFVSI